MSLTLRFSLQVVVVVQGNRAAAMIRDLSGLRLHVWIVSRKIVQVLKHDKRGPSSNRARQNAK
jgi:ribosomal protein S12